MDRPTAPAPAAAAEPRQRWRITFARDVVPPERVGRTALSEWSEAVSGAGLPVLTVDRDPHRPRLVFGPPLPAHARGEAELVDLWLLERLPLWRVREALAQCLPAGHRWVAGEDVWLGTPPLPGRVAAADWRVEIGSTDPGPAWGTGLPAAARRLLARASIEGVRVKAGTERRVDLRPLLLDLAVDGRAPDLVRVRTRFHPERGAGRPEEAVAALAEEAGIELAVRAMTRERLLLVDDLEGLI